MYFRKNSGNGTFDPIISSNGATSLTGSPVPFLKDVNNDFLPDRISFGSNTPTGRVRISYNAEDFQFNAPVTIPVNMPNTLTSFGGMAEFSDLNLDGLTDYVYYIVSNNNEGIYFQYNNGLLFEQQNLAFHHTFSNPNQPFLVRDLTNDGSPDFITWQPAVTSSGQLPATRQPGKLIFRPSSLIPNLSISGRIFYDENENGIYDGVDEPMPYEPIAIASMEARSFSSTDGTFSFIPTEYGSYNISHFLDSDLWELTTGEDVILAQLDEDNQILSDLNFGFKPATVTDKYHIDITSGVQRCGESTQYQAFVRNTGTTTEALKMTIQLDPSTTFLSSLPVPSSINGNLIEYDLESLKFFHFHQISVIVQMPAEESNLNHTMTLTNADNTVLESEIFSESTTCSGTENSVSESVGWLEENLFLVDTSLVYTLRLQNEGDAADFMNLVNNLSYYANISSFELLSFSHLPELKIKPGKVLNAKYADQNFPGMSSDFHGSEAMLKFKLKVEQNTPVTSLVTYTGAVQFGDNLPNAFEPISNKVYTCNGLAEFTTTVNYTDCDAGMFDVTFLATQPFIENYEWSFDGNIVSSLVSAEGADWLPEVHEISLNVSNALCASVSSNSTMNALGNYTFGIGFDGSYLFTVPNQVEYRWFIGNALITVTSNNFILPVTTGTGIYKVRVKSYEDATCLFWSGDFLYDPTSTNNANTAGVLVYPNPVKDLLTIDAGQSPHQFTTFELVNGLGQVCVSTTITSESMQLDTRTINAGLYTLLLTATDGAVYRSKVLVAR